MNDLIDYIKGYLDTFEVYWSEDIQFNPMIIGLWIIFALFLLKIVGDLILAIIQHRE